MAASDGMTDQEWQLRCDLAACYRLVDLFGWSDLSSTHISARLPGKDRFLINPYGLLFDQMTASSLVEVDGEGAAANGAPVNPAGFLIHGCIHRARAEVGCVLHTHTPAGNAVAMQEEGLLPLSQKALILMGWIGYHDYRGVVLDADEQESLTADLADNAILVLRNHGLLTCGATVGEAFVWMHRMEAACRYQVAGLAGGRPLRVPGEQVQRRTVAQGRRIFAAGGHARAGREWPSLLALLERERGGAWRS